MMSGDKTYEVSATSTVLAWCLAGPAKVAFQEIGREKICHKNITWTNPRVLGGNSLHGLWKVPVLWPEKWNRS